MIFLWRSNLNGEHRVAFFNEVQQSINSFHSQIIAEIGLLKNLSKVSSGEDLNPPPHPTPRDGKTHMTGNDSEGFNQSTFYGPTPLLVHTWVNRGYSTALLGSHSRHCKQHRGFLGLARISLLSQALASFSSNCLAYNWLVWACALRATAPLSARN